MSKYHLFHDSFKTVGIPPSLLPLFLPSFSLPLPSLTSFPFLFF